jgi:MFS family permease
MVRMPDPVVTIEGPEASTSSRSLQPRLAGWIIPVYVGVYLVIGAVPSVLLPLQVQGIDPHDKAIALALVTGVGAFVAMVMSPIAGLLSDRTRSRYGRRAPYLVFGALAVGLALIGLGAGTSIAQLVVAWSIVQLALSFLVSPLTALMPDRVPSSARGLFSTLVGLGTMIGLVAGQAAGAVFAARVQLAYLVLPGVMLVVITLFVVLVPDRSAQAEKTRFAFADFLRGFWVSPRRHPDFFWGFLARLLLFAGYFAVNGYELYLLQDYVGMSARHAADTVAVLGVVNLAAAVVAMAVSGPLSDRLKRRKVIVIAASCMIGVAMIVPWAVPTAVGMGIFAVLSGLGFGAYMAIDGALMTEVLPSAGSYAKDLGVLNIAATLPQTIGPFVSGAIVTVAGYPALFPVGVVLAGLGALAIVPIRSVR